MMLLGHFLLCCLLLCVTSISLRPEEVVPLSIALARAMNAGDLSGALTLAKAAPRNKISSSVARSLLSNEGTWFAEMVTVKTLRGIAREAGRSPPHQTLLKFHNTSYPVYMKSLPWSNVPEAGDNIPVQGFVHHGKLVLDKEGHECTPAADGNFMCSIGGSTPRIFTSELDAAKEVTYVRGRAVRLAREAALRSLEEHAEYSSRSLQMGAGSSAPILPAFSESFTTGTRTVLILRVKLAGQSDSDPKICTATQANDGALSLAKLHGARSFGRVTIIPTVMPCLYVLPSASYIGSTGSTNLMNDAIAAALAGSSSGGTCASVDTTTFQHVAVYHPTLTTSDGVDFAYLGLGSIFGSDVWMNGPAAENYVLEHEIGHNYGLYHASTWAYGATSPVEYGDKTDVMGSGSDLTMTQADYQAAYKTLINWIPPSRIVVLHSQGLGAASGAVNTSSFLLAALDRNNPIGTPSSYPDGVALTARHVTGPRSYISSVAGDYDGSGNSGKTAYVYMSYRSQAITPGLYLSEVLSDENGMSNPFLVCNEPLCESQGPTVQINDAYVYDRAGTRTLIEVGNASQIFPTSTSNNDLQNSALQLRVSFLASNGRRLTDSLPSGCSTLTGMCPSDTFTDVTTSGVFARDLSAATPIALFRFQVSTNSFLYATTCSATSSTSPYPVPVGLSAFFGGFPTAHAFYSGSVGLSGDEFSPGSLTNLTKSMHCSNLTLSLRVGAPLWLVVGSPGVYRGSAVSVSLTITIASSISGLSLPLAAGRVVLESTSLDFNGDFFMGGFNVVRNLYCSVCKVGTSVYRSITQPEYVLAVVGTSGNTVYKIYKYAYLSGVSTDNTAYGSLVSTTDLFACPKGAYKSNGLCIVCPAAGMTSSGFDLDATTCACPIGTVVIGNVCTGQDLGGPIATTLAATFPSSCPYYTSLSSTGTCVSCSLGQRPIPSDTYGNGCSYIQFNLIEVVIDSTIGLGLSSYSGGDFVLTGYQQYTIRNGTGTPSDSTATWKFSDAWMPCTTIDCSYVYNTESTFPSSAAATTPALQYITAASLAFCNAAGDSTKDYLGRRLCYCGPGMYKDSNSICQTCAAGTYRPIGIANGASLSEVCINCASGFTSSSGAEVCSVGVTSCSAGYSLTIDAVCTACTDNTYSTGGKSSTCTACANGTVSGAIASSCVTISSNSTLYPSSKLTQNSALSTTSLLIIAGSAVLAIILLFIFAKRRGAFSYCSRSTTETTRTEDTSENVGVPLKLRRTPSELRGVPQRQKDAATSNPSPRSPPLSGSSASSQQRNVTPLTAADDAKNASASIIAAFLEACASGDFTAVDASLRASHPRVAKQLLAATQVPSGRTPLHLAVRSGSLIVVRLLLSAGAPLNTRDKTLRTPLCTAARATGALQLVDALLVAGALTKLADARGRTPLHHAALACNVDVVELLIAYGAHTQALDDAGSSPLVLSQRAVDAPLSVLNQLHALLSSPSTTTREARSVSPRSPGAHV